VVAAAAGDTRETPAIDVCRGLLADGAKLFIYDPKVRRGLMAQDGGHSHIKHPVALPQVVQVTPG